MPIKKVIKKIISKKEVKKVDKKLAAVDKPKLKDYYPINIVDYLVREFFLDGHKEAKRALKEGRVILNGEVITDKNLDLNPGQEVEITVDKESLGSKL